MSKITDELETEGAKHKGTDIGKLLQWAALHIKELEETLKDAQAEWQEEMDARIKLEQSIFKAREAAEIMNNALSSCLLVSPYQTCAADFTSHVNVMAAHGVAPYAKKIKVKK